MAEIGVDLTTQLLSQGLLGVVVVALALVVLKLWGELKAERDNHKKEVAAKDALISELYDQRIAEARVGYDITKSVQTTLDAFLLAVRKGQT